MARRRKDVYYKPDKSPTRKSPAPHAEKSLRSDRMTGKQPLCRGGHHAGGKAAAENTT